MNKRPSSEERDKIIIEATNYYIEQKDYISLQTVANGFDLTVLTLKNYFTNILPTIDNELAESGTRSGRPPSCLPALRRRPLSLGPRVHRT
jgi:hypothetical protein